MYSTLNYCIIIFFAWDICSPNNSAFFYIFAAWPAFGFFFNAGYELGTAALRMYIAVWCATIYCIAEWDLLTDFVRVLRKILLGNTML